jgi:N-glycosidase YbiA
MTDGPSAQIEFYRAQGPYGCFSNLWLRPIVFEDREFRCSEYAYQFGKPNKPEIAEWLMAAPHPRLCAAAAHALLPYDVVPDWRPRRVDRMRRVLRVKFDTYPEAAAVLVGTGDAQLIEASKSDSFWGVGANGKGENMLGVLLMERRSELACGPQIRLYSDAELRQPADVRAAVHPDALLVGRLAMGDGTGPLDVVEYRMPPEDL